MAVVYIGVGSNIDPERNIPAALEALLRANLLVVQSSRFYRTDPIGRPEQAAYANGVWQAKTELSPHGLKGLLKRVERSLGRVRSADKFAARTIDLDILLFDDLELSDEEVRIPDPHILERAFLARCLIELDPELRLPGADTPLATVADAAEQLEENPTVTMSIKKILEMKE